MKIVIDLQSCQNGSHGRGIGRYALSMARALVRSGKGRHTFRVALSDRFPDRIDAVRKAFAGLLEPNEIVVGSLPANVSSADLGNAWRTRAAELAWTDFIRGLEPDAYFTPSLFEGFWDDAVTTIEPASYLQAATIHDLIPLTDPAGYLAGDGNKRAYAHKINSLRRCDFLFSVSSFSRKDAIDRLGLDPAKVLVMPLGVEDEFCTGEISEERRDALLRKYRLKGRFVINTSPYEHRKNIPGLISGFATVAPDLRENVQLIIAGKMDDHARNEIAALTAAEGLAPNDVLLPGFVPDEDLIDLYRLCEVMVFPPFSEGFGLPPLEAMACGAAVLASQETSVPEVVGREDVLFDPADPGDIARAITRVLSDSDYRDELRAFGPVQAATFSWDRSAQGILEAFEGAHARKSAPIAVDRDQGRKPLKLAVVTMGGIPHSRESQIVKDYIRRLSGPYDVTLFMAEGDLGQDVCLPLDRHSLDDFVRHGGAYDRALYILDSTRTEIALQTMAVRPGALILYERLEPVSTRTLSASRMADLRSEGGLLAVAEAQQRPEGEWKRGLAAVKLAHGVAVESDSVHSATRGVVRVTPRVAHVTQQTVTDFRRARGIPEDAELWVAFARDDEAAAEALRAFRSQRQASLDKVWLALVIARTTKPETAMNGRVFVMPNGFSGPYAEIMSTASALMIDPTLPPETRARLGEDARVYGLTLLSQDFELPENRVSKIAPEDVPTQGFASWPVAHDVDFLATVGALLEAAPPPLAASANLLQRLPVMAWERRGEAHHIDDLAEAISANAERVAPGRVLIDVTTVLHDGVANLSGVARRFLRRLLASRREVGFVATDGHGYFTAGAFMGELLGISVLRDEALIVRAEDVLVSIDVVDGVAQGDSAASIGTRRVHVVIEDMLFERPDLGNEMATALLEAISEEMTGRQRAASASLFLRDIRDSTLHLTLNPLLKRGRMTLRDVGPAGQALLAGLGRKPAAGDSRLDVSFTVQGHMVGSYSLAIVNRRIAGVLNEAFPGRVDVTPIETVPINDLSEVPAEDRPLIASLMTPAKLASVHTTIAQHWPIQPPQGRAEMAMALVAWEESHLPPDMIETLNGAFDGVLAQVRTVQKALVDSGVWVPSVLSGLPADISDYENICTRKGPAKTFLHVSSCFPRKGVDVLLEAWGRAFTIKDGVRLVIKTFPNPHNDVQERVWDLARRYPMMAPIQIVNRDMTRAELIDLVRDADVMVLPTRGEGYNLPALESMAAGLPLIVTGHGGHRDFCGPADARLIDYEFGLSGSHVRETVAYWAEPSVDDLVAALQEQVDPAEQETIEARRRRAMASARKAVDPRRWTRTVAEFAQTLAGSVERSPVRTSWVSTWGIRCGIAEYSRFLLEQVSPEWRENIEVVADDRTTSEPDLVSHRHGWGFGWDFNAERLLADIEASQSEAVVIQHQDGLILWRGLADLALDQRLASRVSVVTLHTVRSIDGLSEEDRAHTLLGLSRFDRVLVHTIGDLNDLKRHGLIDNVALFPHGAIRPTTPAPAIRTLAAGAAPIIGCHGFFFDHKRIDQLIRAAARLKTIWPRLRLRLVNARFPNPESGAAIAQAQAVAAEVGMAGAIDWHTDFLPVEEIQSLLAGCDLLVLPYDETGDSVSGAVRVAMCSQVPTLTTPVKIFSDLGNAVATVPTNDTETLAKAIQDLLETPARRAEIQENMLEWLATHDWKRMSGNLEGMVKALAYNRRRRAGQGQGDAAAGNAEAAE